MTIQSRAHGQVGFTLVELMISLVIGLVVVGAAAAVYQSSQRTYRTTEEMARLQEGTRTAFELFSKDVREAGASPCASSLERTVQVLMLNGAKEPSEGALPFIPHAGIVGDSNQITLVNGLNAFASVDASKYALQSGQFDVDQEVGVETPLVFDAGEVVTICDPKQATAFIATGGSGSKVQFKSSRSGFNISSFTGESCTPTEENAAECKNYVNFSKCLDHTYEKNGHCQYKYGCENGAMDAGKNQANSPGCPNNKFWPAYVVRFSSVRWYIAPSSAPANKGGVKRNALFRQSEGGTQEIVLGVKEMKLQYLLRGATSYVDSVAPGNSVVNVKIRLKMDAEAGIGEGGALERTVEFMVTPRNFAG